MISSLIVTWQVDVIDACWTALNLPTQRENMWKVLNSINNDKIRPENLVNPLGPGLPLFCRTLQCCNSPGDWAWELSKPSTDSASLVVKIEKNVFRFRLGDFWRWRHEEGVFWKFWPPLAGPGPQSIDPFYWLKVLLKTRSTSASIEPLIDLLAYL